MRKEFTSFVWVNLYVSALLVKVQGKMPRNLCCRAWFSKHKVLQNRIKTSDIDTDGYFDCSVPSLSSSMYMT